MPQFRALADHLTVMTARRHPFVGDFGVANRDHAEQQGAADGADRGAERHEGEEHQHAAIAFKTRGFKDSRPGPTGPFPSAAPPSAPNARPSKASSAIFI